MTVALRGHGRASFLTLDRLPVVTPYPVLGEKSAESSDVGGKGAALNRLSRLGIAVPWGALVAADAHRLFGSEGPAREALEAIGGELAAGSEARPEDLLRRYPALAPAAAALRPRLHATVAEHPGPRARFAVRSSATGEDGSRLSFAGVMQSFLAVSPRQLCEAVLMCWAAVHTPRFHAYCERNGVDPDAVAVGVIVQEMVPARAAGVLLTHDPVTGEPGPVIDAVWGLASALVGGAQEPDHYCRRPGGSWEIQRGRQEWKEVLGEAGPERAPLSPEESRAPSVLSRRDLETLARLSRRVERSAGQPQDLEWALRDGRVLLLQARPISAMPGSAAVWSRTNLRELYPDVSSSMAISVIERYGANALGAQLERRGFHVRHLGPQVRVIHGRPYINQSLLEYLPAAAGVDTGSVARYVGGEPAPSGSDSSWQWRTALRNAVPLARLVGGFLTVHRRAPRILAAAANLTARMDASTVETLGDAVLAGGARETASLQTDLDHLAADVMGAISLLTLLARALLRSVSGSADDFIAAATVSGKGNPTACQVAELHELVALAREDAAAREWLLSHYRTDAALPPEIARGSFGSALKRFLDRYGCRGIYESDIARPRYREDPSALLRGIRAALLHPRREPNAPAEPEVSLNGAPRSVRWAVRPLLARLQVLYARREEVRFAMAALQAARRRWALALGERWTRRGWLAERDDYFALRIEEVELAAAEPEWMRRGWLKARVARHRARQAEQAVRPMPNVWVDGNGNGAAAPAEPAEAGSTLQGLPVSPGVVEGEAVVLSGPYELESMPPGAILVMPVVGPSWTPLLASAAGLVIEMGGVLSHGSILAREYGLPAVANLPGITRRLMNGDRLRLDGTHGTVQRLETPGHAEQPVEERAAA